MAARMPEDRQPGRMDELLLERERLDQVIKNCFSKEISIVFSDICGFTEYTDRYGDVQSRAMLLKHNQIVLPTLKTHSGKVIEVIGDGVMAAFNDPLNAINAAVDIQTRMAAINTESAAKDAIHLKIGVHTGTVLLDEGADFQSLTGDVANVAARIQSHATADQILLSKSVYDKVNNRCQWPCLFYDDVKFKGKTRRIPVYRVQWDKQTPAAADAENAPSKKVMPQAGEAVLHLEIQRVDDHLKIRLNESFAGEENTIRQYETVPYAEDAIETRCKHLVDVLNKANRRGRMTAQTLDQLREIGQVLYDRLLTLNAKKAICKSTASTMVLSIDDQLVHIPWELLYDGKQFFCLRFCMGRVVSTRQLPSGINGRPLTAPIEMLVLADPTGDLTNAYAEGTHIRDFLDQNSDLVNATLRTDYVTADTLKAKLRNYDIIHFAGHADYNPQAPQAGGWRLRDSRLTTDDILQMAGSAAMPKMVFANACQSARTAQWAVNETFEHEIFGMANAFLLSGVKHYLGTFWEILDEPGSHFAVEFYKHLFAGVSVGRAVFNARRALIDLYGEETIIWASYVFYGDPTYNYMAKIHVDAQVDQPLHRSTTSKTAVSGRTREEVIDFENGSRGGRWRKWWPMAAAALVLMVFGWWAIAHFNASDVAALEREAMDRYSAGDYDSARQISIKLQEDAPDRPASAVILGNIHLARGQFEVADRYFRSALAHDGGYPQTKASALLGLGRIASLDSRDEEALALYRKAAAANADNVDAVAAQAAILERLGQYPDALRAYTLASSLSPDDAGLKVAAAQVRERLAAAQDQAKQARIDQLVNDILAGHQSFAVAPQSGWTTPAMTVWLLDFQVNGIHLQEGAERLIHGLVVDQLVNSDRVQLVERALLDKLLAELKLGSSRLAERQTALSIGRLAAARVMVSGRLTFSQDQLAVAIRLIECETGLVVASAIDTFDPRSAPLPIAQRIGETIIEALRSKFPLRAVVSSVDADRVRIDTGQAHGAAPGMLFKDRDGLVTLRVEAVDHDGATTAIIAGKESIVKGLRLLEAPSSPQ